MIQQAVAPPDVPGNVPGLPAGLTARPFAYPSDLPAMSELVAAANAFDGHDHFPTPEVLGVEWRPTELFDPGRDCLVIEDGSGWAAMVSVDPQVRDGKVVHWTEGWVRPDRRHQGIGRALLSWAERHAADLVRCRAIESADLPQFVGFGVLESNPDAVRFAAASGYSRVRFGFLMRRDLSEPIPEAALPPGIELRPVKPEQHRQIWDADVEAFRDHFEPRERNADEMEATFTAPHMDTALWRVAWEGSEVVGSVMNLIDPDENARIGLDIGWLEHVSVRRAWRGRGVASALIVESMRALRDRGMAIAQLGVDGENPTGAVAIYERLGFTRHETWIAHRRPLDPGTVDERSR